MAEQECKTARCLLEEALSMIGVGEPVHLEDPDDMWASIYSQDEIDACKRVVEETGEGVDPEADLIATYAQPGKILLQCYLEAAPNTFGGWVKDAEFTGGPVPGEAYVAKTGVCSMGAIALASLDGYSMGHTIPLTSYAGWNSQSLSNSQVMLAGLYIVKATSTAPQWWVRGGSPFTRLFDRRWLGIPAPAMWERLITFAASGEDEITIDGAKWSKAFLSHAISAHIAHFNDHTDTIWDDVKDVFTQAIKFAVADEEVR